MTPVDIIQGDGPVILGLPHTGTYVPDDIMANLNERGRSLADTDWHIHQLYDGLLPDVTNVRATFHRYVLDANRSPDDVSLYPGQNTTGLVPVTDFDGKPIWNAEPTAEDIAERKRQYHAPYHTALEAEIKRVRALHGVAILYDCHSIRSHIPFLFDGILPDFNIGTNMGTTCDPQVEGVLRDVAESSGRTWVLNGRFTGGWTTRHYGQPEQGVHAIQMELAQSSHLASETLPFDYDPEKAEALRVHLRAILIRLADLAPKLAGR